MRTTHGDPLRPLSFIVTLTMGLLLAALIAFPMGTIVSGGHVGFGAWGFEQACVELPQQGLWIGGPTSGGYVENLRPGVTEGTPRSFLLCQKNMDGTTRTLFTIPDALNLLWIFGFLIMVQLIIRRARRHGLYTAQVARGVTRLGWYTLLGHLAINLVTGLCVAIGTSHLVTEYEVGFGIINDMRLSWPIIIAGFGLLTVGRIMKQSVDMHRDLEGTV